MTDTPARMPMPGPWTIPAGEARGGYVIHVYGVDPTLTRRERLLHYATIVDAGQTDREIMAAAFADADAAVALLESGELLAVVAYDGDSGLRQSVFVVAPPPGWGGP